MEPLTFRHLADDELCAALGIFRLALHHKPVPQNEWAPYAPSYEPGRTFGAFDGDQLVGTTSSLGSSLTVPGGRQLPMAATIRVAVRADHRRQGALTALMRMQLAELAEAGTVFAALHSTEPLIYGRFGYGVGTIARTIRVDARRAVVRADAPGGGVVRFIDTEQAMARLPEAYAAMVATRTGMIGRPVAWWEMGYAGPRHRDDLTAAHFAEDGTIDGFVSYQPIQGPVDSFSGAKLEVLDFQAADQAVTNDLWRFLLGVDLVDEVVVYARPTDDPIEALLVDEQVLRSERDDELWLRIVDVPAALAGREYDGEPVVIEVVDPLLAANSGRYRVSPHGTEGTTEPAELIMDVDVLSMLYLGAWQTSPLVGVGRIAAPDPKAAAKADRLFAIDRPAWCGSMF